MQLSTLIRLVGIDTNVATRKAEQQVGLSTSKERRKQQTRPSPPHLLSLCYALVRLMLQLRRAQARGAAAQAFCSERDGGVANAQLFRRKLGSVQRGLVMLRHWRPFQIFLTVLSRALNLVASWQARAVAGRKVWSCVERGGRAL
eukprot:434524-Rhodomonas_salina.4